MKKRGFPISAAVIIALALVLLAIMFLGFAIRNSGVEFFGILIYIPTLVFLGENVADFALSLNYIAFSVVVLTGLILSTVSLCLCVFASDKVYCVSKMLCDVLVTLYIAPWAFLVALFAMGYCIFEPAWQWCHLNGGEPFVMLLFLLPVFFIFFYNVKFRINIAVGNTLLLVFALGITRFVSLSFVNMEYANARQSSITLAVFGMAFITLWLFEQILRDKHGKLNILSRILLACIAVFIIIYMGAVVMSIIYAISSGFSWLYLNSLLFAIPVFAVFVYYIIKVNTVKT